MKKTDDLAKFTKPELRSLLREARFRAHRLVEDLDNTVKRLTEMTASRDAVLARWQTCEKLKTDWKAWQCDTEERLYKEMGAHTDFIVKVRHAPFLTRLRYLFNPYAL